jgi:phage-related protein
MWTVETLNTIVEKEVRDLPVDLRARLAHIAKLIETAGFENLPASFTKHLEGKLWELRLKGKSGIGRAIYVTVSGQKVIIVRAFVKKSQKTPLNELAIARERAKELK